MDKTRQRIIVFQRTKRNGSAIKVSRHGKIVRRSLQLLIRVNGDLIATLINGLEDADKSIGLETMCVGGGQGMALIIERL